MTATARKDRIAQAFGSHANAYDSAANVQWLVAQKLAARIREAIPGDTPRVLEIGCGTGFLSMHLKTLYPKGELILTDIAQSMLDRCRQRVGDGPSFLILDGETPKGIKGGFDLIAASLAVQWFVDPAAGLRRLAGLLAPGGRLMFATLGRDTFREWRAAHERHGLDCGTPVYPGAEDFPWPDDFSHHLEEDRILESYADGASFVRALKTLGASEPTPGHRPLSPGAFRRLLASLNDGFSATYHLLYGDIVAP